MRVARLVPLAAALLAVTTLAAGCGSKGGETTTVSAADWASGVCGAVSTYVDSIKSAATSFKSNPSMSALQDATKQVSTATETFESAIKDLGQPPTENGQQAKQAVNDLASQISDDVDTVQKAVKDANGVSGLLSAATAANTAIQAAKTQVSATVTKLKSLQQGGIAHAFATEPACTSLGKS